MLTRKWLLTLSLFGLLLVPVSANHRENVPSFPYATPVFGLADFDGSLFVADAGAGIVELRKGTGTLIAPLPGVTDVAPITRHIMFATTGGNPEGPIRRRRASCTSSRSGRSTSSPTWAPSRPA